MAVVVHRDAPGAPALDVRKVRRAADRMLRELEFGESELSILLTDDAQIRALNAKHRRKDKPTDVLAFPMEAPSFYKKRSGAPRLLGDVVISLDTAARQAKAGRRGIGEEVVHLLAHGILHLVGYDHRTDAEERRMNRMTERLVSVASSPRAGATRRTPTTRVRKQPGAGRAIF